MCMVIRDGLVLDLKADVKSKTLCTCHITLNLYLGLYLDYRHDLFSSSVISYITFLDLREG